MVQRRLAAAVAQVGTGAAPEQQLRDGQLAEGGGKSEGGRALHIEAIDIRTGIEQLLHDGLVAAEAGAHEGRIAGAVGRIDIGAELQQQGHDFGLVVIGGDDEGRIAFCVLGLYQLGHKLGGLGYVVKVAAADGVEEECLVFGLHGLCYGSKLSYWRLSPIAPHLSRSYAAAAAGFRMFDPPIHLKLTVMQKITTFLTYNDRAGEAMELYTSVFKNSSIKSVNRMQAEGPIFSAVIEIEGQEFFLLNGGPSFTFSTGTSLFVSCDTQEEIDEKWDRLSEGGFQSRCGWLQDKFGVSWQIVPPVLGQYLSDSDRTKAGRVMQAMLKMNKIIIQDLKDAYDGVSGS